MATEVGEPDGVTLPFGELVDGLTNVIGQVEVPDLSFQVVPALGGAPEVVLLAAPTGRLGTEEVDGSTVALGEEVGAQRAATGIELVRIVPEPQEHLLHDLLGERGVVEQPPGQAEDGPGVTPVGLGQRVLVVAADRHDQSGIAALVQIPTHIRLYGAGDEGG